MAADRALTRPRRLIVNADDFGLHAAANAAVIQAHRGGILTTASLMVNEPGFQEAVELARENPKLGVGLHITLLHGHSALPPERIPGLVNGNREFSNKPVQAGFRYFCRRHLASQLREEIHAQFAKFRATGLPLDHVNGHLHMHLHPVVFRILAADARPLGIARMRLTRDPLDINLRIDRGHQWYRRSHAMIFGQLSKRAAPVLAKLGVRHTDHVFGLLQNARVDKAFVRALLPLLPPGDSELYSHPSLGEFKHELEALTDPEARDSVRALGIHLIRYQDL